MLPINPSLAQVPVYQPGRPIEEVARELNLPPEDVIKLASNENPLGPSPMALAAMEKAGFARAISNGIQAGIKQARFNASLPVNCDALGVQWTLRFIVGLQGMLLDCLLKRGLDLLERRTAP